MTRDESGDAPDHPTALPEPTSSDILARLPAPIRRRRLLMRAASSGGTAIVAIIVTASVIVGLRAPHQSAAKWPLDAPSVVEVSKQGVSVVVTELTPGHVLANVTGPGVTGEAGAHTSSEMPPWLSDRT